MRIAQEGLGETILFDILKGFAQGKAWDLEDARPILKYHYNIQGTDDINQIRDSHIIVITAGLSRKPGMTREDLLQKNAAILKGLCLEIKKSSPGAIIIVVTNPLDLMAHFCLKATDFNPAQVIGMGVSLDASRFANLISREFNIPVTEIEATVIGSHGQGMIPLPRFTKVKGIALDEFCDEGKIKDLIKRTILRGAEIVSLLGSGSAYFAPSAAITELVRAIVKDQKRTIGVSAYLNGEYALKDVCIGVPCRLGKGGIEKIIELDLNQEEKNIFSESAQALKQQFSNLTIF